MGRRLRTTVLVDGVVYEAGTDESDIADADAIRADVWDIEPGDFEPEAGDTFSAADVAALREQYDVQLAERDEKIAALEAEIEALTADPVPVDAAPAAAPEDAPSVDYSGFDLDDLKAEIDRRNEGRADADRIGKRGSVETLAAALVADDAAAAASKG